MFLQCARPLCVRFSMTRSHGIHGTHGTHTVKEEVSWGLERARGSQGVRSQPADCSRLKSCGQSVRAASVSAQLPRNVQPGIERALAV